MSSKQLDFNGKKVKDKPAEEPEFIYFARNSYRPEKKLWEFEKRR